VGGDGRAPSCAHARLLSFRIFLKFCHTCGGCKHQKGWCACAGGRTRASGAGGLRARGVALLLFWEVAAYRLHAARRSSAAGGSSPSGLPRTEREYIVCRLWEPVMSSIIIGPESNRIRDRMRRLHTIIHLNCWDALEARAVCTLTPALIDRVIGRTISSRSSERRGQAGTAKDASEPSGRSAMYIHTIQHSILSAPASCTTWPGPNYKTYVCTPPSDVRSDDQVPAAATLTWVAERR
jgi:hypothetical protein